MRGLPEPGLSVARGLQAEKPLSPADIMREADVLDLELGLSFFPRLRPSQMRFVELLPKFGDLDRIAGGKEHSEGHRIADHHAISSASRTILGVASSMLDGFPTRLTSYIRKIAQKQPSRAPRRYLLDSSHASYQLCPAGVLKAPRSMRLITRQPEGLVHGTICENRMVLAADAQVIPVGLIVRDEFTGAGVNGRAHPLLAILTAIVVGGMLLSCSGSAIAQTSMEKQAQCELSAIRDTRSPLAIQFIRSACNWLALNGDSLLNESSKGYYVCLVRQLSGAQADEAAAAIVSACRSSSPP